MDNNKLKPLNSPPPPQKLKPPTYFIYVYMLIHIHEYIYYCILDEYSKQYGSRQINRANVIRQLRASSLVLATCENKASSIHKRSPHQLAHTTKHNHIYSMQNYTYMYSRALQYYINSFSSSGSGELYS